MVSVQAHSVRKFCNLDPPLPSPLMPTTMGEACTANASSPYISIASGIFAYLNYLVSQKRLYVLETLINGLKRLEYRGYDSAGVCRGRECVRVPVELRGGEVDCT